MNAPLPRAQLAAFRASLPPAPEQPRAIFRVRQRSMMTFDVVRTLSGPGITPIEALPYVCCEPCRQCDAEAFAARAAVRFSRNHPGFVAVAEPFPVTGRRPGQSYSAPVRDPDDEHRLGPADCLHGARGW